MIAIKSDPDEEQKRQNTQLHFWNIVGSVEHINRLKLEDTNKDFDTTDDRLVQSQIKLMQTGSRIKVQSRVEVWIKH